jgi:hypothetical protein
LVHQKKHLNFNSLRKKISEEVLQFEDLRQEAKVDFSIHDCCLSTYAMMFFQDPSMLEFQKRLERKINLNNLKTIFNVSSIPKSSQLKDVMDEIPSSQFDNIFLSFFRSLQRGKLLEQYRFIDNAYLIPIDGTQYFSSKNISCSCCLTKVKNKNKDNEYTLFYHQVLAAAIVHPDLKQVIPLAPEPIKNIDGTTKQDCETNAGKRILSKIRAAHPKLKIIITADDLFSKQPFIEELQRHSMSYIIVAKPSDHKILYNEFDSLVIEGKANVIRLKDSKGRLHVFEWVNQIPLNGNKNPVLVNYFEYTILNEEKIDFHSSWVTDIHINENNIIDLARGGRAKWKIENENFNTLKNQGYHAEHNFGHGKKNLSFNFFIFNLLAFYAHQILELTDRLYKDCRATFSSRKEFLNQLRCTIRILVFENWVKLLNFILDPPEEAIPP